MSSTEIYQFVLRQQKQRFENSERLPLTNIIKRSFLRNKFKENDSQIQYNLYSDSLPICVETLCKEYSYSSLTFKSVVYID